VREIVLITRTPLRISLLGGTTDAQEWLLKHSGEVISTSINKYCYIMVKELPNYFEHKYRIVYREIEAVKIADEIKHPSVRECIKFSGIKCGLELHHSGDIPARSGLGSSSAFTVGLLNALYSLQGIYTPREILAREAIYIEQNILKEEVGSQDQIACGVGGFNRIIFDNGNFSIYPIITSKNRVKELNNHLMLFYTRIARTSSDIIGSYAHTLDNKRNQQRINKELANEGLRIICSEADIRQIGDLLHEYWLMKKSLGDKISNNQIDELYEKAREGGAIGGKILGAGSGGSLLLFVEPHLQDKIKELFKDLVYIPFEFESLGSHVWRH
jgi:D-glycero-alpha-D-manno-heptose-7-phosphate kinase